MADPHPADDGGAEPAPAPDPFAVVEALNAENAALKEEVAGLKDRALRALAEADNLRKRTEREVADARTYGVTAFARDMLAAADNFRRALDALTPDMRAAASAPLQALVEGLELTERDFHAILARHGVRPVEPLGQKFDPNLHQAMFEVPDESVPPGTVAQVLQTGYAIGDRVLRPALVGVAKGGPKSPPAAAAG